MASLTAQNTPNYIEVLNSNGSQPWQKDTDSNVYSGYKFDKKLGCWLWCRISGNTCELFHFGASMDMTCIHAATFDTNQGMWIITESLERLGNTTENWVKNTLARSIDGSRDLQAYIRTRDEALTGLDAIKLFQGWFKLLNDKTRRIDTARRLFPGMPDNQLFKLDKSGNITGVSVAKHTLFQQYLLDVCNGYTDTQGKYHPARTSKDVGGGIEFDNLIEWYLPSKGVFSSKRKRR
jgi:hypothetical protein